MFLAGLLILGAHVEDAVGVDVEAHFNLWHPAWGRVDAVQLEVAEFFVVIRHRAFALKHHHIHRRLIVGRG